MNDKIYAVSSGEYSGYKVHFACPDRETAEACAAKLNAVNTQYSEFEVEEMPVASSVDDIILRADHFASTLFPLSGGQPRREHYSIVEWAVNGDVPKDQFGPRTSAWITGQFHSSLDPKGPATSYGPEWDVTGQASSFPDEESAAKALAEAVAPFKIQLMECQQWWDHNGGPCIITIDMRPEGQYRCLVHNRDLPTTNPCPLQMENP